MEYKINSLFDYIKQLRESDLDRVISFVLGIVSVNPQPEKNQIAHTVAEHRRKT